jgi:hypothetical protein
MPAMRSRFANLRPNYLLASRSIDWAHRVGARFYNWQASPPEGGVHRFKAQWGGRDYSYSFLTRITGNAEPYLGSEISEIAAGYPWHYVLPFDRIAAGNPSIDTPSSRRAAWQAKHEAGL